MQDTPSYGAETPPPVPPPYYMPPPPPKKSRKGWGCLLVFLVLLLAGSVLMNVGLLAGSAVQGFGGALSVGSTADYAMDEFPAFEEDWSYGDGEVKVVRIALQGVIMRGSDGGIFDPGEDRIQLVLDQIRAATEDELVKGIIMEVDSPGGGVTPSDEIYDALMRFREGDDDRRIVVFMRDLAASGGYYVAIAGDYLMAEPTTILGSIGVIMQSMNVKGLSEKLGVTDVTIKSGENKDFLNPFQEVKPEQLVLLQEMIDEMYVRFAGLVQERRGLSDETMREMADGRVWSSEVALKSGFIDEIGYWDEAVVQMATLLGEESIYLVRYRREVDFWETLTLMRHSISLPRVLDAASPRFLYMWKP